MTKPIPPLFKASSSKASAAATPPATKAAPATTAAASTPTSKAPAPSATAKAPAPKAGRIPPAYRSPSRAQTAQAAASASSATAPLTIDGITKRLQYFEELARQHQAYIGQLKAVLTRSGIAAPVAYFAPLTGAGGSFTPQSG